MFRRFSLFLITLILLGFVILSYFTHYLKYPLLGLSEVAWTAILVIIWLLIALMPLIRNHQYISYSDEGDKIVLRYFTTGLIGGKKNSVEINKSSFSGYKTDSKMFGLIKSITLFQKYKEGVAKYPPVYISSLSRNERENIIKSLNQYCSE
jgi:hypothetical protein